MSYKLSNEVMARILEIFQEGMEYQVDVSDLFRLIELEPKKDDSSVLVLSEEYKQKAITMGKNMSERLLKNLEVLRNRKHNV